MANIERLNLLLDLLKSEQADPKHEFCLTGYVTEAARVLQYRADRPLANWNSPHTGYASVREHPCGTVCCALGLASLDPRFNELGFTFEEELGCPTFPNPVLLYSNIALFGITAGAAMLDIPYAKSAWLFSPTCYPRQHATTLPEVIERLERLIRECEEGAGRVYEPY